MSNISMVEANLPPGFRFYPKDEELVCDYLMKKVESHSHDPQYLLMIEVDLNKCEPWDIPESACVGGKQWYFYSQRDRKYATGLRTNRATASGYWKATGKDRPVLRKGTLVGMRKTLVFYQGRAPKGQKTDWIMHEFRLDGPFNPSKAPSQKEDWVLCRVLKKNKESAKPSTMRSWSYDNGGNSLLPPLMDSFISIDQEYHEQVPCFSVNFSHNQTQVDAINNIPITSIGFGHLDMTTVNTVDPLSYDKKLLKSVLDQVTKIDHDQSIEDSQTESFLSELGLSNMWSF